MSRADPRHDAVHSESGQAHRIKPEEHGVIEPCQLFGHVPVQVAQQEHDVRHHHGHQDKHGILEHFRRNTADDQVPDHAAPAGGGDGQDIDTENIHFLMDAHQRAGNGEGDGADEIKQGQQCNGHALFLQWEMIVDYTTIPGKTQPFFPVRAGGIRLLRLRKSLKI